MQPSPTNVLRAAFRDRGAGGVERFLTLAGVLAFAGIALVVTGASAVPSPSPTPGAAGSSPTFTIQAPGFSPTNTVGITGTKDAGAGVNVLPLDPGGQPGCSIPQDSTTSWACTIALPNGRAIGITAQQTQVGGTTAQATTTLDVLGPPTLDGSPDFLTSGLVSGLGFPGAAVTTIVSGAPSGGCGSVVTGNGYWSCALNVGSGHWVVAARQSSADIGGGAASSPSDSLGVIVDKDAPASPAITSPRSGGRVTARRVTFRGTGETAGTVDVYLDNTPVCTAHVTGADWACTARAPSSGRRAIVAIQRDPAGNYSRPSAAISLFFGPAASAGATPPPVASPSPTNTESPSPSTQAPEPGPTAAPPSADGGGSSTWGTPTGFGSTLPTLAESITRGNWLLAPLFALAFILLIALPLRMLATVLRGRIRRPDIHVTGRNRYDIVEPDGPKPASPWIGRGWVGSGWRGSPWIAGAIPLSIAAAIIVFSGGVNDEVRFLRLAVAVCLGLGILNVAGVAIPARLAGRRQGITGRLRTLPILMLAATVAALLSRITGNEPPVVAGILIGVGFARGLPAKPRAIVNLVEVGSVTVLAIAAWLANGALGPVDGFWLSTVHETLATIALAGLGSAAILVLPVATLPGRVILEWSPPIWLATGAIVGTIAAAVILGGPGADFPVVGSLAVAGAFAALSLAVWSWLRFVEPVAQQQPSL